MKKTKKKISHTAKKVRKPVKKARKVASNAKVKRKVKKQARTQKQAEYLSTLPKGRFKRMLWRLHPKRVARYWFSRRGLIMGLRLAGVGLFVGLAFLFGLFAFYRKDLPTDIAQLQACVQGQTTEYYDSTGETLLWASQGDVDCTPVDLAQINDTLVQAVLAVEDQKFFEHSGFDWRGVLRAGINNVTGGRQQGGSTITQQYVKNAILQNNEKLYSRKIKELILSVELSRSFSKEEVLNAYLNVASFGSVYDGIEAASRGYFEKPAADLTLDESALLAAAIPAPTFYWNSPEDHVVRQQFVLRSMLDQGRITQAEFDAAMDVDTLAKVVDSRNQYEGIIAPHFVLEAEQRLVDEFGEGIHRLGLQVITTIDLEAQELAEQSIEDAIPSIEARGFDNGAAVAVDTETGKVIALVGSRDFDFPGYGQSNVVAQQRDPGSAFKIFDYASVIENTTDYGAGSIFYDYKTELARDWEPKNYNGLHNGPVTARFSLGQSFNIPAIKAMYIAGIEETHLLAREAGLRTPVVCGQSGVCGLATAFGSGAELRLDELTNSYATFSREGTYQPLTYIDQVIDADGEVIKKWEAAPEDVIDPQTAYILTNILTDDSVRFARNTFTVPGVTTAVKTGTDDGFKNNTVLGYSKSVAFGAWFGHHDITRSFSESNTTPVRAAIFRSFMSAYHKDLPESAKNNWQEPEGIKRVQIDPITGFQVASGGRVDIYPSWYVPKTQDTQEEVEIDSVSGGLATECTPERAIQIVTGGNINAELPEDDPYFNEWNGPVLAALGNVAGGAVPTEDDDLHDCGDNRPSVSFVSVPALCDQTCAITVDLQRGTHALETVNFSVDGQILPGGSISTGDGGGQIVFNFEPDFSGSKALNVEVVDSALYDASINRTIVFEQTVPVALEDITVGSGFINVSWNRPENGLELDFGGACDGEANAVLPGGSASTIIDTEDFPTGSCNATLINNGAGVNTISFDL